MTSVEIRHPMVHPLGVRTTCASQVGFSDSHVSYSLLRQDFSFVGLHTVVASALSIYPNGTLLLVFASSIRELVEEFQFFTLADLRCLARAHGLSFTSRSRRAALLDALRVHEECHCVPVYLEFRRTMQSRPNVRVLHLAPPGLAPFPPQVQTSVLQSVAKAQTESEIIRRRLQDSVRQRDHRRRLALGAAAAVPSVPFPDMKTVAEKQEIIREWQRLMTPTAIVETACAVCAWSFPLSNLSELDPSPAILSVLQNECLPLHVLPSSYDLAAYRRAILCPDGMTSLNSLAPLQTCSRCRRALLQTPPRQPKFALANFLYYGKERLPENVARAFQTASPFDLMLISRSRSSTVTHHFVRRGARDGYVPEECSQRFNRGNVAIFPQDPGPLRDVLPPSGDDIRNTVCVLFSGGRSKPTAETLKRFGPVLVCKSKVEMMIRFLINNNEWYQANGVRFSEQNLASLFTGSEEAGSDYGVLQYMQVDHAKGQALLDEDPDPWVDIQDDIVMDNVAYTLGDHSPRSRESMKAHALAYALDRKRFLNSMAGSIYVSDNHPGLLSYMFPHLDPWGIGGFNHPGRSSSQRLSFESQLKCLLRQYRSPFAEDPNFAFVCWNIVQKLFASRQVLFSMKTSEHEKITRELSELAPSLTEIANKWTRDVHAKPTSEKERQVVALLRRVQLATKKLKGSPGYKTCRRNEIRSLIRRFSTPALFITLNPHDLSSILLATLGGLEENKWREMSAYERAVFVASHPGAAARAFDLQIASFFQVVVRYGKGSGLFGTCKAYYGTVEAQGRGTLHCHLLLWLEGNPNPQELRDRMVQHPGFRDAVFSWMEDIIKCELPGMREPTEVVNETPSTQDAGHALSDCRVERPPQVASLDGASFTVAFQDFVRRLAIKCNWHVHTDTCYKHLEKGEPRSDGNCRMAQQRVNELHINRHHLLRLSISLVASPCYFELHAIRPWHMDAWHTTSAPQV